MAQREPREPEARGFEERAGRSAPRNSHRLHCTTGREIEINCQLGQRKQGLVSVAPSRYDTTKILLRDSLRSRGAWLGLLLGLTCTLGWATFAVQRAREQARREFEERSRSVAAHVEESFRAPLEALYGIHALGCALPDVDQHRFEQFASRLLERYPSLAALELFDVVPGVDRDDFERHVSARLGYAFSFQEPSGSPPHAMVVSPPRERHVVLTRLLPFHRELHGLDIAFDPMRRAQMAVATRAGTPMVTEKFRLVEDPEGVFSVAVYDPLYESGQVPASEQERERQLRGFAVALYRLAPLMRSALAGTNLDQTSVRDRSRPTAAAGKGVVVRQPRGPDRPRLRFSA